MKDGCHICRLSCICIKNVFHHIAVSSVMGTTEPIMLGRGMPASKFLFIIVLYLLSHTHINKNIVCLKTEMW